MTSRDEDFQPESIDEDVQQLKRAVSQPNAMQTPNTRLIQDLRLIHAEDTTSGQRVWERLATRMAEQNTQGKRLRLITNEPLSTERSTHMQTEQPEIGPMPAIQPGKPARKFKRIFTLVAALFVALLLVGSLLVIVTNMHPYGGFAAAPTPTPTPTLAPTATNAASFPASDCPKVPGTPGQTWTSWYQLCQAGKFTSVNLTQPLTSSAGKSSNETIEAAYADRNMLFLVYDFSPIESTNIVGVSNLLTTQQGLSLERLGGGQGFTNQKQHFTWIDSYDTSNLPANLQTLTVKVNSIVNMHSTTAGGTISGAKTNFAFFTVPLYSGQMLTPQQTVTANGVAITLTKVMVDASGLHAVFAVPHIPDAALSNGFTGTLHAGSVNASAASYSLLTPKGSSIATGFDLLFENNLSSQHGGWTLTVTSHGEHQSWVFHFTVPA